MLLSRLSAAVTIPTPRLVELELVVGVPDETASIGNIKDESSYAGSIQRFEAKSVPRVMFRQLETLSEQDAELLRRLRGTLEDLQQVCVAYSGGVDSSLVAAIAHEQLGERALAITGVSPSLAPHLREEARQQAAWLGLAHREVHTHELEDPTYSSNPLDRCYACKRELHRHLAPIAAEAEGALVVDGVNQDDLGDHRPGIAAAREAGVRSPLAELGVTKTAVRQLSRALGFPWWDKPAQPCLASRFPYGESISSERLQRVGQSEAWLIHQGFEEVRVRSQGTAARVEVPEGRLDELMQPALRRKLVHSLLSLGFTSVSVDLEGLVSGKLNRT